MQRIKFLGLHFPLRRTALCAAMLAAATGQIACSPVGNALWTTGQQMAFKPQAAAPDTASQLDPAFEYMRISVLDSSFFATRVHAQNTTQGKQEIWLTPANEILRTLNGRLTSTTGSAYADWVQSSTTGLASWQSIAKQLQAGRTVQYLRTRDVEPGGFAGLKERVIVVPTSPTPTIAKLDFPFNGFVASDLHWFEEHSEWIDSTGRVASFQLNTDQDTPLTQPLPPAKFAVRLQPNGAEEVVYSEQCLSYKVCLRMQRWPVAHNKQTSN